MYELYDVCCCPAEHPDAWSAAGVPPRSDARRWAEQCRYDACGPGERVSHPPDGVPCSWGDDGPVVPPSYAVHPNGPAAKPGAWAEPDGVRCCAGPEHDEHQDAKSAERRDAEHSNAQRGETPVGPKAAGRSCDHEPWTRAAGHHAPSDELQDDERSNRGVPSGEGGSDDEHPPAGARWDAALQCGEHW